MTKLAVVAYPTLPAGDRQWIESVRARHDPQASRIQAHFTLVFPVEMPREPLVAEITTAGARFRPIPFVLRRAAAFRDPLGDGSHVFLLPEEGRAELLEIYDRLYDGALQSHLRTDVPFVPHVTVGAHRNFEKCERVAEELNRANRTVAGTVDSVQVIEIGEWTMHTVAEVPLG